MFSRRAFLSRSSLAAATVATFSAPHIARSAEQILATAGQKPKRIIHIVSDGMSLGTFTCANQFSELTRGRSLSWKALFQNPAARQGFMNTRSLNSLVTDSAAAASSWGSGSRVVNGALNTLPDGHLLTPLYALFAAQGWATGLVTTAEITHATPAGFAVAVRSRGNADAIAAQYLEKKLDVMLGGGRTAFHPAKRKDKRDLHAEFAQAGYTVAQDLAALEKAPLDTHLLGTFADGHLPYTIDHRSDAKLRARVPTLARLTEAALARLERHERFILQVEGARIDHAAHNSDAAAAIHDQVALDEAIDLCLAFQQRHPDTLLVLTTDHANSNLGLNGMGGGYRHSSQRFAALSEVRMSYPEILKWLEKAGEKIQVPAIPSDAEDKLDVPDPMAKVDPNGRADGEKDEKADDKTKFTAAVQMASAYHVEPKTVADIIADATGYKMSARRAALFSRVLAGDYPALYDQMSSAVTQLGQLMANRLGIGWTGNTHTSDYAPVLAIGPGAEHFAGFIENTDVFTHYTQLAGIDFKNHADKLIAEAGGPAAHEAEPVEAYAQAWTDERV